MTPERAAYHRLMLLSGQDGEYLAELNMELDTAPALTSPVLDLAFCMSDREKTLTVLQEFLLDSPVDWQQVYDMVIITLRRLYSEKQLPLPRLVDLMYTIAIHSERAQELPWHRLTQPCDEYDLVAEGIASEKVFADALEAFLFRGERMDVWERARSGRQKKSFWSRLFRR